MFPYVSRQANHTDSISKKAVVPDTGKRVLPAGDTVGRAESTSKKTLTETLRDSASTVVPSPQQVQLPGYIQADALQREAAALPRVQVTDTLPRMSFYFQQFAFKQKPATAARSFKKNYVASVFRNHELTCTSIEPRFIVHQRQDWVLLLLIFFLGVIGTIQYFYKKRFDMLTKAFFIQRFATQLVREDNILNQRISILLNVVFTGVFSYFIYRTAQESGFASAGTLNYPLILLLTAGFFVLKYYLNRFIGFLFLVEKEIKEFVFNYFLINQYLGIALVCLGYWVAYASWGKHLALYLGWGAAACAWLFQLFRGYNITSTNKRISKLYLFCYLCTLEILPIFLIGGFLRKD